MTTKPTTPMIQGPVRNTKNQASLTSQISFTCDTMSTFGIGAHFLTLPAPGMVHTFRLYQHKVSCQNNQKKRDLWTHGLFRLFNTFTLG